MEVTLPVSSLIIVAISSVGVILSLAIGSLLLFQKDKKHISVTLLGLLLILSGLTLFNDLLATSGISNRLKFLYFTPIYYSLSIGPLFYLFIKSKFSPRLSKKDCLHLVLPVAQALVYFSIGFRSVEYKSWLWESSSFPIYLTVESFLFPVILLAYVLGAWNIVRKQPGNGYFWSDDLKIWLHHFASGLLLIAGIEFILSIADYTVSFNPDLQTSINIIHGTILTSFIIWMAINGFKQYFPLQIYKSRSVQSQTPIASAGIEELRRKILWLMEREKVFLNPDLNLSLLSNYLDVTTKTCSNVLNQGFNTNFNTFVNSYRIDAFKEKIKEGRHKNFTLSSLAYDCGFDSKSTFYRVFKSVNGMTPTEYLKYIAQKNS